MYQYKYKQSNIINNNLPFLGVLCACGIFYLCLVISLWYLLFLCVLPFCFINYRPNWKQVAICFSIFIVFVLIGIFARQFSLIDVINKRPQLIRKAILKFYDTHYSEETACFIKLILFNIKSDKS